MCSYPGNFMGLVFGSWQGPNGAIASDYIYWCVNMCNQHY